MNINTKNRTSYKNPTPVLSVIIVTYNVKYFLEQCLHSVQKALAVSATSYEVIVIDNQSSDGTISYLQPQFPFVKFYYNKENTGFSKANNQGWKMAKGDYVLFLNPDTLLGEESIYESIKILKEFDNVGAVGIRMIDGSGTYLKESKRGVPTPEASFYKLSGLIHLFPQSSKIAHYYMGHLDDRQNAEVEVLAGAYMMVKKSVLQKTGGFDENYFMYGEDVDLSYRIRQIGYKNIYIGNTSIIHFKGESTRKDVQYFRHFYKAMELFANKHFRKGNWWLGTIIQGILFFRTLFYHLTNVFYFPSIRKGRFQPIKTLVIADSSQACQAMDFFANHPTIKRTIRLAAPDISIGEITTYEQFEEIVFVADKHSYKDIISQIMNEPKKGLYWFTAFESSSMVCSYSSKQQGGVLIKQVKSSASNKAVESNQ